jgi:hypothetical protein
MRPLPLLVLLGHFAPPPSGAESRPDPAWRAQVEREWFAEAAHRLGAQAGEPAPAEWAAQMADARLRALEEAGRDTAAARARLRALQARLGTLPAGDPDARRALFLDLRSLAREAALAHPRLDFDTVLFAKRVPGQYNHMSDQYYGWWSSPGGAICLLRGFRSDQPEVVDLTSRAFPEPGSFLRPSLSFDGQRVLFAWCRYYPHLAGVKDKLDKANVPEDAFYHIFEMNVDGTGLRQLTRGKYDDFDAHYLPGGRIVFCSTRRGQALQVGKHTAAATLAHPDLPDGYVRCGGDAFRPVAVYTLHTMDADGGDLIPISPFEMFEWEPAVAHDGTILYSRWDYIDRDNMPFMSLWSIHPDGTDARALYGNYTHAPHCTFEPRPIPGSNKILFTASGHHSQTLGSLVLFDPARGSEGPPPIERLTPEVVFPEIEGWPSAYYTSPWPLSERTHLVSWGVEKHVPERRPRPANTMGIHLFQAGGGLELLYRDPTISSLYAQPLRARPEPPQLASRVDWEGAQEGRLVVSDVTRGLKGVRPDEVKALRVVAVPIKTQPRMNQPALGVTRDDPGKAVLGTVPVEADGSAYFRVPSGMTLFLQVLDARGRALQTMRSATHVQPGETRSCTGCHAGSGSSSPVSTPLLATRRDPSPLRPPPSGAWPLRFAELVQPVLDARCGGCHASGAPDAAAPRLDPAHAYESLVGYGRPSLRDNVMAAYRAGVSTPRSGPALTSPVLNLLTGEHPHHGVRLTPDEYERLVTWLDTYGQRLGAYSEEQERDLADLRRQLSPLFAAPAPGEGGP